MRATFCPGCGSKRGLLEAGGDPEIPSSGDGSGGARSPFERICARCLLAGALGEWPEAKEEVDPGHVLAGRTLGNYEVLARIGAGSTGTVYRARQRGLDRLVALKVLGVPGGRIPVERFLEEARALARLRHPGIVAIFEVGSEGGRHFYAMDLVDGPSLAQALRRDGPLAPERAARLLAQVARAVEHAHGLGIVHRDLKPANILIAEGDDPRVADFGLARDALAAAPSSEPLGAAIGTAPYMAPEQAGGRSHAADARTDVYGLGAVLYECLAGRPPFRADRLEAILEKVRAERPDPIRAARPEVDAALEAICLRALEKDPSARHPTARALAEALDGWRSGSRSRAGRRAVALALAASVVAAALGVARPWDSPEVRPQDEAARLASAGPSVASLEPVTTSASALGATATAQALASRGGNASDEGPAATVTRDGGVTTLALADGPASCVALSPDGACVAAALSGGRVIGLDVATGARRFHSTTALGEVRALAFFEGGKSLAAGGTGGLARIEVASGRATTLTAQGEGAVHLIVAAPQGFYFAVGRRDGLTVIVEGLLDQRLATVPGNGRPVSAIAFDPSDFRIATASEGGSDVTVWSSINGRPVRSLGPVPSPVCAIAFAPDGERLAALSGSGALTVFRVSDGVYVAERRDPSATIGALGPVTAEGVLCASACADGVLLRVMPWRKGAPAPGDRRLPRTDGAASLAFAPRASALAVSSPEAGIRIFDLRAEPARGDPARSAPPARPPP